MKTGLTCKTCESPLIRSKRSWWERVVYRSLLRCRGCRTRVGDKHRFYNYFARTTRCPFCGASTLVRREKPDRVDRVLRGPISLLQQAVGGALFHCELCRVQFYDVRTAELKLN